MYRLARIAIRVDASTTMGTGHLKRCLSLAQALAEAGAELRFVCRPLDAVAAQVLAMSDVTVLWLPAPPDNFVPTSDAPPHAAWACVAAEQDAKDTVQALASWRPDWVVADHYAFDARWHRAVRDALDCRLLVIDDTADRLLDADVLLDHNWAPDHRAKYAGRLAREPHWLTGPRYALLAPAYSHAPRYKFHPAVRSIGIFMGGTDPGGISAQVLCGCREAGFSGAIEVASTSANPHLAALRTACDASPGTTLTLDEPNLAAFFARHDLQIGAGGGATWERCCIGAPSVLMALAANQTPVLNAIETLGIAAHVGPYMGNLSTVLRLAIDHVGLRQRMCEAATALIDGCGAARVANYLIYGD